MFATEPTHSHLCYDDTGVAHHPGLAQALSHHRGASEIVVAVGLVDKVNRKEKVQQRILVVTDSAL